MKFRITITSLFVLLVLAEKAQKDSLRHSFMRLVSFSAGFEPGVTEGKRLSQDDLINMAPMNYVLNSSSGELKKVEGTLPSFLGWNISTNWQFRSLRKKKYNEQIQLNFDISFITNQVSNTEYYKEVHVRFDTLISDETPTVYYIDTVKRYSYNYDYKRTKLFLSLSNTFHTKQDRVLSVYAGYSLSYGWIFESSVRAHLEYSEDFQDQVGFYLNKIYPAGPHSYEQHTQVTDLPDGNVYVFSVPIGIVARTGADGEAKRLSFTVAIRPGYTIEQIPGLGDFSYGFVGANASIKYFLHKVPMKKSYKNFFSS